MKCFTVTCENLPQAVSSALAECHLQLKLAIESRNPILERDLKSAIFALHLIDSELKHFSARPKQQRSGAFIRYVVDEDPNMVMDEELKHFVIAIESIYKQCDVG